MLQNYRDYRDALFSRIKNDEKSTTVGFMIIAVVIGLLLIDVVYLNYNSYKKDKVSNIITETANKTPGSTTPLPTQAIVSTTTSTTAFIDNSATPNSSSRTSVRDYFIPLGSGTGQNKEWEDVLGAQATVDFTQYSPIKEIRFEVSVNVPTGNENVSVRLYNVTDKHPVWYSEVTMVNNSNSYLTSSPIIYDFGSKLYQVQMKTQLQYPANLTQSRIHVISK